MVVRPPALIKCSRSKNWRRFLIIWRLEGWRNSQPQSQPRVFMRECFCQCPESPWPLDTLVGPDLTFTWFSVIFLPFPTAQFNCNILIGSISASHLHRAPPSMRQNWPALTIQWSREVFLAWGADMITSHILSTNWWYELHWLGSGQWGRI